MQIINSADELQEFLRENENIKVYGARFKLRLFLELLKILGYPTDYVTEILVTGRTGNPESVEGIPVHVYKKENFECGSAFLLTLASDYLEEVSQKLEQDGFHTICITERLLELEIVNYNYIYRDVYSMMSGFTGFFPDNVSGLNKPVFRGKNYAWSCWWQGLEAAPDVVRACINSMKRYLPQDVEMVVITGENYKDYVEFPQYLLDKLESGGITLTTFSDIIRAALLYKYGGIWLDSTILLTDSMPRECWDYDVFTIRELRYCLSAIGGKPGQKLFQFLMEGFFYYYKNYDNTKYYLLVTYIMDIAMNTYPEIREIYNKLPEHSSGISKVENYDALSFHMHEKYTPEAYLKYMDGIYLHKLQRRFERFGARINDPDNIYRYILSKFL